MRLFDGGSSRVIKYYHNTKNVCTKEYFNVRGNVLILMTRSSEIANSKKANVKYLGKKLEAKITLPIKGIITKNCNVSYELTNRRKKKNEDLRDFIERDRITFFKTLKNLISKHLIVKRLFDYISYHSPYFYMISIHLE
ncbi:hypothetical protein BpHYR1_010975 [Brachionus plicatilis]|uniref:Uncharacterized protein n=1 Tax=Brachionus plicatilis TaxID=10195 RepID=A0A3M7T168_BRAPC|nr:hypothetical protein BpHYR1_010975 [Brachionus plicatilis]